MTDTLRPRADGDAGGDHRDVLYDVRPGDRWLIAVAHPDDESFGCGSLIARAAVRGAEVTVACATRGEAGEAGEALDPGDDLGAVREAELHRAAGVLGAARVEVLGYRDSGFDGPPAPGSLVATPVESVAVVLERQVRDLRPHVVVVLDGSDGHRDHLHVRSATRTAVRRASRGGWTPRLYEHCLPNSLLRRWLAETAAARGDDVYHGVDPDGLGRPDQEITDVLDVADVLDRREAAIAEHRSQNSPFDGLSAELRRAFLTADHLVRVDLRAPYRRVPVPLSPAVAPARDVGWWDCESATWRPCPAADVSCDEPAGG